MNAIILAAGQGVRLKPLTNNIPKCLVNLFGKSLLEHQLKIFRECGIKDISVVRGFLGNLINFSDVTYFTNKNYESTNMVESLFCAKEKMTESIIISYGDIIFTKEILEKLIKSENDCSVIVDTNWKEYWDIRFENPLEDAESLKLDSDDYITNIGQKTSSLYDIQGQYIGLMKFQGNGLNYLKSFYEKAQKQAKLGTNLLNSKIKFEQSYMTDLLQGMINDGCKLKAVFVENGWLEVDSLNDYETYNEKFHKNSLSKFYR